ELSEIESVMVEAEGVRAAACTVCEEVPGVEQLVGYVVPSNGRVDEERLRAHLRSRLPAYMVPALIETITELPALPSGKLDRASLPQPRPREIVPKNSGRKPRTDTEISIAKVWETLSRTQPVSIDDDFLLDVGAHSLL